MATSINSHGNVQKGYTLIEVLIGMMVIAFSLIGLVQAFVYGNAYVEKFGYKRQATILLDAEMENLLALKKVTGQLDNLDQLYEDPNRQVDFGRGGVTGMLSTAIERDQYDEGLKYWEVELSIRYGNTLFRDTACLASRFYSEGHY